MKDPWNILIIFFTVTILFYFVYLLWQRWCQNDIRDSNINLINDLGIYDNDIVLLDKSKVHEHDINPNFVEMKYHNDYRDTLAVFDILDPIKKDNFNVAELPITDTKKPDTNKVNQLVNMFVSQCNSICKNQIEDKVENTWDKSGWEKHLEKLGLPTSIYNKPTPKAPIKLIKIDDYGYQATEHESKYTIYFIAQKINTKDQIIICVNFIVDNNDSNLDREFFEDSKNEYNSNIRIGTIDVIGFLTPNKFKTNSYRQDLYRYDIPDIEGKMFSQEDIIRILNKKKRDNKMENV